MAIRKWGALAVGVALAGCSGSDVKQVPSPDAVVEGQPQPAEATQPTVKLAPIPVQLSTGNVIGEARTPDLSLPNAQLTLPKLPEETATPIKATSQGWSFYTGSNGLPPRIYGAAADEGGNIWVAGGSSGVFVLKAGETQFHGYGTPYPAISIAGGPAGVAFVGYMGVNDCDMAWDTGGSAEVYKSGDADRLTLSGNSVSRSHYDIYSGPGVVAAEPQGREKLCNIFRIKYDKTTGSVWFGGNHGVAWGDPVTMQVVEHTHPAINGYMYAADGTLHYTLLSGDYNGLATDAQGNLWLGGRERSAFFPYANLNKDFWAADGYIQQHKIDVWEDEVPDDPRPSQEVLDETFGFAPMPDGTAWVGSEHQGLALINSAGEKLAHYVAPLRDKSITAMATDPKNNSMWAGHGGIGGLTRLVGTTWYHYGGEALGGWASSRVNDIQVQANGPNGKRRILVAFQSGAVGVYDGD